MRLDDVQLLKPGGMGKWICKALPTHGTGPGRGFTQLSCIHICMQIKHLSPW